MTRLALVVLAALALVAACASPPAPAVVADPARYDAALWPQRPVVSLDADVAPDLRSVREHESVVFTPDLPTCEMVFRAWPDSPTMSRTGSSLTVTGAAVDGRPTVPRVEAAGAPPGAPGTLVRVPLPRCLAPGEQARSDLDATLTLGERADERVGVDTATRTAWFGSGFPLLAWVRGRGWATDPAVPMNGETAVSEDAATTLAVRAPSDLAVTGVGTLAGREPGPAPGTTTHRFTAPAVRDVAVGVGRYAVAERDVGGVRVHLATPSAGTRTAPDRWLDDIGRALTGLSPVFGPYPYRDLWVTITPGQSDGTEFPSAVQFGDSRARQLPALVTHEVAHQWFYGLVGDDQARDPWLDESFAAFAETLTGDSSYRLDEIPDRARGRAGEPMAYWPGHGGLDAYTAAAYDQGAAVLADARARVGPQRFDTDLRAYVAAGAHRVATRADVARAFAGEPELLDRLARAGALPPRP